MTKSFPEPFDPFQPNLAQSVLKEARGFADVTIGFSVKRLLTISSYLYCLIFFMIHCVSIFVKLEGTPPTNKLKVLKKYNYII